MEFNNNPTDRDNSRGYGASIASLVLGICGVFFGLLLGFFFFPAILGLALGIVGVLFAISARKAGCNSGISVAGLVLSIIATAVSAMIALTWVSCIGLSCSLGTLFNEFPEPLLEWEPMLYRIAALL